MKAAVGALAMWVLVVVAFWGTVGYIAVHFISKFW